MKQPHRIMALIAALVMCLSLFTACGQSSGGQPSEEIPPAQSQQPTPPPADSAEPENTRVVEEDYEFEGPGIFETFANYPDSYKQDAAQQGRVEQIAYNNGVEDKYFLVYLPYGYDSSDESYNVLYLMHGGNGRPEVYLQTSHASNHQKLIDNMIQNGEVAPFILVAPTWNSSVTGQDTEGSHTGSKDLTDAFAKNELTQYVIPLVDENYRTNATREGRAFGGFSMGAVTTWYTFLYDLDYIKYFVPMSGDCWVMGQNGGGTNAAETVAALEEAVANQGYTGDDFVIYALTGTQDIAMPNMAPQVYAMQDSSLFVFGENTFFGAYLDGLHIETFTRIYLYNALPLLWQND